MRTRPARVVASKDRAGIRMVPPLGEVGRADRVGPGVVRLEEEYTRFRIFQIEPLSDGRRWSSAGGFGRSPRRSGRRLRRAATRATRGTCDRDRRSCSGGVELGSSIRSRTGPTDPSANRCGWTGSGVDHVPETIPRCAPIRDLSRDVECQGDPAEGRGSGLFRLAALDLVEGRPRDRGTAGQFVRPPTLCVALIPDPVGPTSLVIPSYRMI